MSCKSKELTKQQLIDLGIKVEGDKIFRYRARTLQYNIATTTIITGPHKYGKGKQYIGVPVYDATTKKTEIILAHRIIYAWYNGVAHAGMTIDHIDGNSFNNNIENLREVTLEDNLKFRNTIHPGLGHNDSVYYGMNGWDNDTVDSYQIFLKCKHEQLEAIKNNRQIALSIKADLENDFRDIKRQWIEYRDHFRSTYSAKMSYREASTDPEYQRMYQEYKAAKTKYGYAIQQLKDELKTYTKATKHAKEAKFQP